MVNGAQLNRALQHEHDLKQNGWRLMESTLVTRDLRTNIMTSGGDKTQQARTGESVWHFTARLHT